MNVDMWTKVVAIVDEVADMPQSRWQERISRSCGGDRLLEFEVNRLLANMAKCPPGFLPLQDGQHIETLVLESTGVLKPGARIGHFEILNQIGWGGTSVVYSALQQDIRRRVALKVSPMVADARQLTRMRREADLAGRLRHSGIVTIYEHGEESGYRWIAMELVEGHDLGTELRIRQGTECGTALLPRGRGAAFVREVVELTAKVADALQAAHVQGVVHRDVKPGNILLQRDCSPKIADFGLARCDHDPALTRTGDVAGTPFYMSPEQARGTRVDSRTDLYSLGAVLFHLLTDEPPFVGRHPREVVDRIIRGPTPTLRQRKPRLPADLEAVVAKAMAETRDQRYSTASALADDLRRFLRFEAVQAKRQTASHRLRKWLFRHRRGLGIGAVVSGGATALAILLVTSGVDTGRWAAFQQQVQELESRVPSAIAAGDSSDLVTVASELSMLRSQVQPEHPDLFDRLEELRGRLDEKGREIFQEARAAVTDLQEPGLKPFDDTAFLGAVSGFETAARLMIDTTDPEPLARLSAWFPRLRVDSDPPAASVRLHPVRWPEADFADEGLELGTTPIQGRRIKPGYYRLVLEVPGYGFAELSRWLAWDQDYDLGTVVIQSTPEVTAEMVRFEGGECLMVVPVYGPERTQSVRVTAHHGPFYLDRYEVSNAEYLEFWQAHDESEQLKPGPSWRPSNSGEWRVRPVVGVSWSQARAFAEWVGKRLPTEPEWNQACTLGGMRKYPWGDQEPAEGQVVAARHSVSLDRSLTDERLFELYMEHTEPVQTAGMDVTPEGVFHLAGNVSEWTDAVCLGNLEGRAYPLFTHRRSKGWNWNRRYPARLFSYVEMQAGESFSTPVRGFRCAKSVLSN